MIVCLCEGVNDREISSCFERGSSNLETIGSACGAGTGCGHCHSDIRELLGRLRSRSAPRFSGGPTKRA